MKKKRIFTLFTLLMVIALTATTVLATSPYYMESGWLQDPLFTGRNPKPGNGLYWRDTTNQNALANQSYDEFTGTVIQLYPNGGTYTDCAYFCVLVYSATSGPNVIALVGYSGYYIVGAGGGYNEAYNARAAFAQYYPGLTTKSILGIILTDANPDSSWGTSVWRGSSTAAIYASADYNRAKADLDLVGYELYGRQNMVYGSSITPTYDINHLTWGIDSFVGAGTMRRYGANRAFYTPPDTFISEPTFIPVWWIYWMWGPGGIVLDPTYDRNGTLKVYLVQQHMNGCRTAPNHAGFDFCISDDYDNNDAYSVKMVLSGDIGSKFLAEAGSLTQSPLQVRDYIADLDQTLAMVNNQFTTETVTTLIPAHGLPVACNPGCSAVADPLAALNYIKDETLNQINQLMPLDDIATTVHLPEPLASSPYTQEFAATTGMLVRSVYEDYLGWYGGDPIDLVDMSTTEQAEALLYLAGGTNTYLSRVKSLYNACNSAQPVAPDLSCAKKALFLIQALRTVSPSADADRIYIAALKKLAWSSESAQVRNYFLDLAFKAQYPEYYP